METREWRFIDKSEWGEGAWQSEPDKVQWMDPATGLPCLILRHPQHGQLCGYVGVGPDHPMHGAGYDLAGDINVHGGLTFADHCSGDERGICHVVDAGEPDNVWWFGFDCGHAGDYSPGHEARMREVLGRDYHPIPMGPWGADVYRDIEYVRAEVTRLASQLAGVPV